jgi:hypothetical protein
MVTINNGDTGHLVIPGVHDGRCGIQSGTRLTVAFRWARGNKRPENCGAVGATLDGVAFEIASLARSPLSDGFYAAVLTPVTVGIAKQL